MKIREIELGGDYAVTVPRRRPLADSAERELAARSLTADVVLTDSALLYRFPKGEHYAYGFRARVVAKSLPHGKTDLGVMVEFSYRIGSADDAPQRTETQVIHASRVLATWDDWLLAKEARRLWGERWSADRQRKLDERRARGELTELDERLEARNAAARRERGA